MQPIPEEATRDEEGQVRTPGGGPGRVEFVHRSWPADPAQLSVIRHELAGWLAPLALTDDETADVVLAVDEAAANAVRHAYGPGTSGRVELTMWTEPGTLCVEIVDHGSWRPPAEPTPAGAAGGTRGAWRMSGTSASGAHAPTTSRVCPDTTTPRPVSAARRRPGAP